MPRKTKLKSPEELARNHIGPIRRLFWLLLFSFALILVAVFAMKDLLGILFLGPLCFVMFLSILSREYSPDTFKRMWWLILPIKLTVLHVPDDMTVNQEILDDILIYSLNKNKIFISCSKRKIMILKLSMSHL